MELNWLPVLENAEDWGAQLRALARLPAPAMSAQLQQLATSRLDFAQAVKLDRVAGKLAAAHGGEIPGLERVRVAVLGSSTTAHLLPGLLLGGLRRGLWIEGFEAEYGTYRQALFEAGSGLAGSGLPGSGLAEFAPEAIVLTLDARHVAGLAESGGVEAVLDAMRACWRQARVRFGCQVIQQTVLPVFPRLLGSNEGRLPGSPAALVTAVNERLRAEAPPESVDLLAVDALTADYGLPAWYEAAMWHHAKQEVHPRAGAMWGEHAARLVAAGRGRSAKCLVLDLDNTLWGGVIGDDGVEGIALGQGSAAGEAFAEFQRYCRGLAGRGVVLAVCSKNDEATAREPFARHPEMVLRAEDIACFVANWTDKAANLREIAGRLNLGLDALVFVDDNPVERALIRREMPEVHVPEMPDDPAEFAATLAAAGYFESLGLTPEDEARGAQYRANADRDALRETATDIEGYLRSLRMVLTVAPVDDASLRRVTQLINKTNQFNVLTRRRTEAEVRTLARDRQVIALQARLVDQFGDNGIIAVVTARLSGQPGQRGSEAVIDDWLMSCRVLGRRVEEACLQVLADACVARGVRRLVGEFRATAKNGLVRDLYARLGFVREQASGDREGRWMLELAGFVRAELPIAVHAVSEVEA